MKKLLTIVAISLISLSAYAVDCAKHGGQLYPADQRGDDVAKALGVKGCRGQNFKATVKGLNEKINLVAPTAISKKYADARDAKRTQKVNSVIADLKK